MQKIVKSASLQSQLIVKVYQTNVKQHNLGQFIIFYKVNIFWFLNRSKQFVLQESYTYTGYVFNRDTSGLNYK